MEKKQIDLSQFSPEMVRNFSVIAHIDHGKSTLCDRLLEFTGTISAREKHTQFLDRLQVEKERGITVKAQSASMFYTYKGKQYLLNLIDTPGHVDFNYEVSRSLYACQGALLLVDAGQGVQAQTMANFYLAFDQNLTIIPVINKIDMETARPELVIKELENLFDFQAADCIMASAKTGKGIEQILAAIIEKIPAPIAQVKKPLKALLFDSWYNEYKGVVCLVVILDGVLEVGDSVTLAYNEKDYEVLELGILYPDETPLRSLYAGQMGYVITGMKTVKEARVGDTMYHEKQPITPLPGFKPAKPMVFAGIYPVDTDEFHLLQDAIEKLTLTDASIKIEKKSSTALGLGFRCGFLGLLHMDVFKQRLEQEYNLSVIVTAPSVLYKVQLKTGTTINVENPSDLPDSMLIASIQEPIIKATVIVPKHYLGSILNLCQEKRGIQQEMSYLSEDRVILTYLLPLNEIATNFYDRLKSLSSGYASLDYEEAGYREAPLVKMDILLNSSPVDALSVIIHKDSAERIGRSLVQRLQGVIPRQMFAVAIQAAIGSTIIARTTISAYRKDVIAKCYGGDITRKKKLLEQQKEGKTKMKQIGSVTVPKEAFLSILQEEEK